MKVLADTALILDLFANRGGFAEVAERLLTASRSPSIEVHITERCLETIRFYLSKPDPQLAEDVIDQIRGVVKDRVIPVTFDLIDQARSLPIRDLEAAVEVACATTLSLSAIVTQHPEKYTDSILPVWTVDGLIERQRLEKKLLEPGTKKQPTGTKELQDLIQIITEADTDDFFELARLAGLSPTEDFSGANLRGVDLRSTTLVGANFINTDLSGAILINADLEATRLIGAFLISAILTGAKLDYANLVSADFTGANLVGASLKKADLTRSYLNKADLSHANLYGANLTAATLCESCLYEATLSYANLRRADLSYADLSGASLYGADLSNCDLRMTNLTDTNLTGATVVGTLFGDNPGLSKEAMVDLSSRGAMFYVH